MLPNRLEVLDKDYKPVVKKFYIKATGYKEYKGEWIEAIDEACAVVFYRSALAQGHVPLESEEFTYEVDEETDEEE